MDVFFCDIFASTGQAADSNVAKEIAIHNLKDSPLLIAFIKELQLNIKLGYFSDLFPAEKRLTPAFDPSSAIDASFGYHKLLKFRVSECRSFTFNSTTIGSVFKISRFCVSVEGAEFIAAVGPTETAAKQQCTIRYALYLMGYMNRDTVERNDTAIRVRW